MDVNKLPGQLKVAILMHAVGPHAAKQIFEGLSDEDKKTIYKLQRQMDKISPDLIEQVAKDFMDKSMAGKTKHRRIEHSEDQSSEKKEAVPDYIKAIQAIDPGQLIQLIRDEHPQTIALILVHLKPNIASAILAELPDEIKSDVAFRIANLDKVVAGMMEEISKVFDDILKNKEPGAIQEAGGVGRLAEILNQADATVSEQIIDEIEEIDPDLADEVKQMMFVFDDIVLVDDRGLQKVLRNVESSELAIALKASTEDVKAKIFRNMSERAAEILKEEIESSGAVRMKEVTDAQQKITRIVQEMERKGELIISGRGGEEFIG